MSDIFKTKKANQEITLGNAEQQRDYNIPEKEEKKNG